MNISLKAALACVVSAVSVSSVAVADDALVQLEGPPEHSEPGSSAGHAAAPANPPLAFPGKKFPEITIGGLAYEMKPAGSLKPNEIPSWYGDPKLLQPNAPLLVPAGFLMPSGQDEKAIFDCEMRFSMVWAALIRFYYGVGKVGDLPPGFYDHLIKNLEEFNKEMQLVCGNAVRLPPDQRKNPSKVPGRPNSPCRSQAYLDLLKEILARDPIELTGEELKELKQCSAWGIVAPPLR